MSAERVLCKVFDILDVGKPDMSVFNNRLKYQKIVYLLQSLTGLSLGYGFNWYLKGPYSSSLAHTLYFIQDSPTVYKQSQKITFKQNKEVMSKLEEFKEKLGASIDDPLYLEILASLHYIDMTDFSGNGSLEQLEERLIDVKPYTSENKKIIEKAYKDLRDYKNYAISG